MAAYLDLEQRSPLDPDAVDFRDERERGAYRISLALADGDMLEPRSTRGEGAWAPRNADRSREILEDLNRSEPDNGAPLYYLIELRRHQGAPASEIRDYLRELSGRTAFDTGFGYWAKRLRREGSRDLNSYLAFAQWRSVAPYPSFAGTFSEIKREINDPRSDLGDPLADWGLGLRDSNRARGMTGDESVDWSALEFSVGASAARLRWRAIHGDAAPLPPALNLKYRDVLLGNPWMQAAEQSVPSSDCRTWNLDSLLQIHRKLEEEAESQ